MQNRIQIALGLTATLLVFSTTAAFAKGSFAFISVSGEGLKSDVRLYDTSVTQDWFAFADFQRGAVPAPLNIPKGGYEITRYYIDGRWEVAFDKLHYYPQVGLVHYDGIVNGWSEYDGKWYRAKPEINVLFEKDLQAAAIREALRHVAFIRRS